MLESGRLTRRAHSGRSDLRIGFGGVGHCRGHDSIRYALSRLGRGFRRCGSRQPKPRTHVPPQQESYPECHLRIWSLYELLGPLGMGACRKQRLQSGLVANHCISQFSEGVGDFTLLLIGGAETVAKGWVRVCTQFSFERFDHVPRSSDRMLVLAGKELFNGILKVDVYLSRSLEILDRDLRIRRDFS